MTTVNSIGFNTLNAVQENRPVSNTTSQTSPILTLSNNSGEGYQTSVNGISSADDALELACEILQIDSNSPDYQKLKYDVTSKYNTMINIANRMGQPLSPEMAQIRMTNYIKGWAFNQFGINAAQGKEEGDFVSDCSKAKNYGELTESYIQFGKEFVEIYDQDGNGSVDILEMFYEELFSYYSNTGCSPTEAKTKTLSALREFQEKYQNRMTSPARIASISADEGTETGRLFNDIGNTIFFLHDSNSDGLISDKEAAVHLLATAQMLDNKNNISGAEYRGANFGMIYSGYSLEDLMNCGYTREQAEGILAYVEIYQKNVAKAQNLINP